MKICGSHIMKNKNKNKNKKNQFLSIFSYSPLYSYSWLLIAINHCQLIKKTYVLLKMAFLPKVNHT